MNKINLTENIKTKKKAKDLKEIKYDGDLVKQLC